MAKMFKVEISLIRYYDTKSFKQLLNNITDEFETDNTALRIVNAEEYSRNIDELEVIHLEKP